MKHKKTITVLTVLCLCILSIWGWYDLFGGKKWIAYQWHAEHELYSNAEQTTCEEIYSDEQILSVLEKYEYLNERYDLEQVVSDSFVIPGLKATYTLEDWQDNTAGPSTCTSMTPQGIALTEDYVLISAYCYTGRHHSVIYVVDREDHSLINTVVLFDKSHVGSLTYDDVHRMVWVCCHDDDSGYAYVRGFSLQDMEAYSFDEGKPITFTENYPIKTQKRASFMTYYDNALYIGYFNKDIRSEFTVQRFDMTDTGELIVYPNVDKQTESEPDTVVQPTMKEVINGGMQGYVRNDSETVILRSYGSNNPSKILYFDTVSDDIGTLDFTDSRAKETGELPPMAEETCMDDEDNLYICFESAAYAYRARETDHIDRILVLKKSSLK